MNNIKSILNRKFYSKVIHIYIHLNCDEHTYSRNINITLTLCLYSIYKDDWHIFDNFLGYKKFGNVILYE